MLVSVHRHIYFITNSLHKNVYIPLFLYRDKWLLFISCTLCSNLKLLKIWIWIANEWRQAIRYRSPAVITASYAERWKIYETLRKLCCFFIYIFIFLRLIKTHSSHSLAHTHWHTSVIDHLFVSGPVCTLWNAVQCTSPLGILTASLFFSVVPRQHKAPEKARVAHL